MGANTSKHSFLQCNNDYELVIKSSKELEYVLEDSFGARGKGLHEKISSCSSELSSPQLVRDMRFLATIRNKLIHERGFDRIPDRAAFVKTFERSAHELEKLVQSRRGNSSSSACVIS